MTRLPSRSGTRDGSTPLRKGVYRYFFYGWLFRDADVGSGLERASALRHNREKAKWLPVYVLRWLVGGGALLLLETVCEHALGSPVVSAALALALIFVALFLLITVIHWLFLRADWLSR